MRVWIYKWLPIIFGCHCRSDRSFYWKGTQFPICARCTGELVGILLCPVTFPLVSWSPWIFAVLMLPMILDGVIQMLTSYESNNRRRFFNRPVVWICTDETVSGLHYMDIPLWLPFSSKVKIPWHRMLIPAGQGIFLFLLYECFDLLIDTFCIQSVFCNQLQSRSGLTIRIIDSDLQSPVSVLFLKGHHILHFQVLRLRSALPL